MLLEINIRPLLSDLNEFHTKIITNPVGVTCRAKTINFQSEYSNSIKIGPQKFLLLTCTLLRKYIIPNYKECD